MAQARKYTTLHPNNDIAEVGIRFSSIEISPHHDLGLSSGLKWTKFRATLAR